MTPPLRRWRAIPLRGTYPLARETPATGALARPAPRPSESLRCQRGFSLLEVLVAFAIAALALGMLYQVMGSNASQAGSLGQHERAMLLAESLLAAYDAVPAQGLNEGAQAAGYGWQVSSRPYPTPADNAPQAPHLHEVLVSVQWLDGTATRTFSLTTLRPEQRPMPGAMR